MSMMLNWTNFKSFVMTRGLSVQWINADDNFYLKAFDGFFMVDCVLNQALQLDETADFQTNFQALGNKRLARLSNSGNPVAEMVLSTGIPGSFPLSVISHDLTDRTSWYQKSVQVVTETLTTANTLAFNSVNPWWVNFSDATSNITATSFQVSKRDGSFGKHSDWYAHIFVNGVEVTSGFTIDYDDGVVTFILPQLGVVTATYWHTNGIVNPSEWLIVPPAGKKFTIDHVELQFSKNIVINGIIRMEIWAGKTTGTPLGVDTENYAIAGVHFPDALFGDPRTPGTGFGQRRFRYRNARDFINAANEGQGFITAFAEITQDVIVMPFNYVQSFIFDSAVGTLMRVWIENNAEFGGELVTAAFYLTVSPS